VESPTAVFTSPSDAAGRFMKLTLVRSSATIGTIKITDRFANVNTDGFVVTGAGQTLEISCSAAHIYSWLPDGTAWNLHAICDPTPEALNSTTIDTIWKSRKNSAGNDYSFPLIGDRWTCFNAGVVTAVVGGPWFTAGSAVQLFTAGGSALFLPCVVSPNTPIRHVGHLPHVIWLDTTLTGVISVPIDAGVVGQFKQVAGLGVQGVGYATQAGKISPRVG
jgi:hypothetical protein